MSAEATWRREPKVPFQEIDGRAVIVVPARRELHELDEVATFLWAQLASPRTAAELVAAVCADYDVDEARAAKDVRAFLDRLDEKGLLVRA